MPVQDDPPGTIYASLTYADARAAIAWLCKVFGFQQRLLVPGPDGSVRHSELSLEAGVVMVSSPRPEAGRQAPGRLGGVTSCLSLYVPDPDAHFARAQAAGADIVQPPTDEEDGARGYQCRDPEGHLWYFADYRPGAWWEETED